MPNRKTLYTPSGQPTTTTVRTRKSDGVVFRKDRPKITTTAHPAYVPPGQRFTAKTPARSKK